MRLATAAPTPYVWIIGRTQTNGSADFLASLEAAFQKGELCFFGDPGPLAEARAFAERVRSLRQREWVVGAKPPFGGPAHVLAYLARYTHRAAIANSN